MSKNNLDELNEILFETLRGVKNGTIDTKRATTIMQVGNTLVNSAKVQLQAFKTAGSKHAPEFFSIPEGKAHEGLDSADMYEKKHEYAIFKGYKNVADAIGGMGKGNFESNFKRWLS